MGRDIPELNFDITIEHPASKPERPASRQEEINPAWKAEVERRYELAERARQGEQLQTRIFSQALSLLERDPAQRLERMKTWETLQHGAITHVEDVGQTTNHVHRMIFSGAPETAAYTKFESGRARFCERGKQTMEVIKTWDESTHSFSEIEMNIRDTSRDIGQWMATVKDVHRQTLMSEKSRQAAAEHYGVDLKDIEMNPERLTSRLSIPRELERAVGVSALDTLTGLNTVAITVVRRERSSDPYTDNRDIFIAQEAIDGKQAGHHPDAKTVSMDTYLALRKEGPHHPAAASWMRNACAAYLYGFLDQNLENMRQVGDHFITIDTDNCFGYSRTGERNGKPATLPINQLVSSPLEAVQLHPEWKLDDEARASLKKLYESFLTYVSWKERKTPTSLKAVTEDDIDQLLNNLEGQAGSQSDLTLPEVKKLSEIETRPEQESLVTGLVSETFRYMFGNEKIASKEAVAFVSRLAYLVDHGRPPMMMADELSPLTEPRAQMMELMNENKNAA